MWNSWFIKTETIGCDISGGYARLAQVQGLDGGTPKLVVAERELPHLPEEDPGYPRAVADLLREMLRSAPFHGTRVVSCLPARSDYYRTMRLAPMPQHEVPQAIHWKAAAEMSINPDALKSALLASGTIREGSKPKIEALVVATPVAELDRHLDVLGRAGLKPVAVDASICAIARCLGLRELWGPEIPAQRVFLELRQDAAILAVVGGTEIAFARPVGDGLRQLDQALGDLLEVPAAAAHKLCAATFAVDAALPDTEVAPGFAASRIRAVVAEGSRMYGRELARQVALTMHYYATTYNAAPPEIGTIVSDRPMDPAGLEAVAVQSGIDFSVFDADRSAMPVAAQLQTELPGAEPGAWATAIGLSLYEYGLSGAMEAA